MEISFWRDHAKNLRAHTITPRICVHTPSRQKNWHDGVMLTPKMA